MASAVMPPRVIRPENDSSSGGTPRVPLGSRSGVRFAVTLVCLSALLCGCGGGGANSPTNPSPITPMWSGSGGVSLLATGSAANILDVELRIDGTVAASSTSQTPRAQTVVVFGGRRLPPGQHSLTLTLTQVSSPFEYTIGAVSLLFVKEVTSETISISCLETTTRTLSTGSHVLCSFTLP